MTIGNMKNRSIPALVVAMLFSGCATVDHVVEKPDEWVHYAKGTSFGVGTDETRVNQPLTQTLANVSEYAAKCFNGKIIKKSQWLGGQPSGSIQQYTSGVSRSSNGMDYFYVQSKPVTQLPFPSMPKDGYFVFASEISGDDKRTKLTSYYPSHFDFYLPPLKQWVNGNKTKCPDLD